MTLSEYIRNGLGRDETLTAAMADELLAAIASRGKNKGRIKSSLPARGKIGRLGWNAIFVTINDQRCALWSIAFEVRSDGTIELWENLVSWCKRNETALNLLGTKPYQFNTWDHNNDRDRADATTHAYVMDNYRIGANCRSLVAQVKREREREKTNAIEDSKQTSIDFSGGC